MRLGDTLALVVLTAGLFIVFLPYAWMLSTALKTQADAFALPPKIVFTPTLNNFARLLQGPFLGFGINSLIVTIGSTAVALTVGVPAGYGLSTARFRGRTFISGWLLGSYVVPSVVYIVPLFIIFLKVGLVDSYLGLILAYQTGLLPFTVWMMKSYFTDIPLELEEAARIDGCTRMQAFVRVMLPLALPGVSTVAILVAIGAWNEYFLAFILGGAHTFTSTVGIYEYVSTWSSDYGALAAATLYVVVPILLATMGAQRGLLRGLTAAAVKG